VTIEDRINCYAEAFLAVTRAEQGAGEVEDELFRFARVLEGSDELRGVLADPHVPAERRQQVVEDLLGGKASNVTVALVSMVVGAGRASDLPAIVDEFVSMSARENRREIAQVRSAIELTEDQRTRLAEALGKATGKQVDVMVIVDPSVLGGIVAQIGDIVIDGSVRHRIAQLKETI
jgi:F-type H+-transporting ATPase subunit delta